MPAKQPGSNGNLDNIRPKFVDFTSRSYYNIDLILSAAVHGVYETRASLTSEDMSVRAAPSLPTETLISVTLAYTAETKVPRSMATQRALQCQYSAWDTAMPR